MIEDAQADAVIQRYQITQIGSVLYVPLMGEGRDVQGILSLMRRRRGTFDDEQIRMAQVFAARAAAAIHAAKLYDQTRRTAETNAILLRKLNHRVKNNLSGIVALLSVNTPQMPGPARQWLDRAIHRIDTMARAHDLFSGGMSGVGITELIETTLATVMSAKGEDVRIETELQGVDDAMLSTDQAVTLAMVLHELAYNALAHALGGDRGAQGGNEGGRLLIRARRDVSSSVSIDVIDEPLSPVAVGSGQRESNGVRWREQTGPDGDGAGEGARGMGLELVRGLVGRELRGTFRLAANDAGGTTATIEFAVATRGDSARFNN